MPKLKRVGDADNRGATDFIESLDRGLRVLEVFGGSRQPMTLSDLAKAADLPRATARRILFTLERAGFVATDGKLFRLMPRVLVLASSYLASNHVVSVLQPALDKLSGEAQEISSMAILDGNDVVFIARASPTRIFSAGIDIGYRLPAFCTSVGRVLLSRLPDDELAVALGKMDLTPLTPFTVTDKKLLLKTIIADRAEGYSLVDREAEPGFRSISVPVRRYDGAIVAAINHHYGQPETEQVDSMLAEFTDTAIDFTEMAGVASPAVRPRSQTVRNQVPARPASAPIARTSRYQPPGRSGALAAPALSAVAVLGGLLGISVLLNLVLLMRRS